MSGPEAGQDPGGPVDEFDWIERCLRPLAADAPEALDLLDDAAALPSRPGFDLIVTKDAIVEGVHFLPDTPFDLVARKLLRTNLSDLAAKGAEPYGYLLATAWPARFGWPERRAFAEGLRQDQQAFGLRLFGGDSVATPGPFSASATLLGWVPAGGMIRRGGARPGELVLVSGTIGDGGLGLLSARGDLGGLPPADLAWLSDRYQLPRPRLELREALRGHASAGADVSDGLIADAGHIAAASGVALNLDLDRMPLSSAASAWLARQADPLAARVRLATAGDDYELLVTAPPEESEALQAAAAAAGAPLSVIGTVGPGQGVAVRSQGAAVPVGRTGWRHGA